MTEPAHAPDVAELLAEGAAACRRHHRPDLQRRLAIAGERLRRSSGVVCVVGAYKQGKSRLVNSLVGTDISPVDDDLATVAATILYHREEELARVRRTVDGEPVIEVVPLDAVWRYASERDNAGNALGVEVVEIGLPSPFLAEGISIVDTPGVGALRSGATGAVLQFLPYADVLIFVTDASSELTTPEMAFLEQARSVCPSVLVAVTKIDMHPEWRRITHLDGGHLERAGLATELLPVSAELHAALGGEADTESGFEGLADAVRRSVTDARAALTARTVTELSDTLTQLAGPLSAELRALEAGTGTDEPVARLRAFQAKMTELRSAGGKWRGILADGLEDLGDVYDAVAREMRAIQEATEARIADCEPASEMDQIEDEVKRNVAAVVTGAVQLVTDQGRAIADRIAALVTDLDAPGTKSAGLPQVDLDAIWTERGHSSLPEPSKTTAATTGFAALRGAQGGLFTMGMLTRLAGVALTGPLALGIGGLFGIKQVRDIRTRALMERRRVAGQAVRSFLDAAHTELRAALRRALRELRRTLRDHFEELLGSLADAYSAAAASAEQAIREGEQATAARIGALSTELIALQQLGERAEGSVPGDTR